MLRLSPYGMDVDVDMVGQVSFWERDLVGRSLEFLTFAGYIISAMGSTAT